MDEAPFLTRILALTCSEPLGQITDFTGYKMARAVGVSRRSVQRIWDAQHLQLHRLRTFKRSSNPTLTEKVEDSVGLTIASPMSATRGPEHPAGTS